jgi:hypothetical protein
MEVYSAAKFVQLLGAHYWRRTLGDQAIVIAVSPGLIGGTQLGRYVPSFDISKMADAKTPADGAPSPSPA